MSVWFGWVSSGGGHDGSCSVPVSGREANRVRLPGHPFATHHKRVVGMERYGHSRAGLNHLHRPAPPVGSRGLERLTSEVTIPSSC